MGYQQNDVFNASYDNNVLQVLRNVYLLLALSLIPTVIGAVIGVNIAFALFVFHPILSTVLMIAGMYFLMFMVERNKYSFAGIMWLLLFTFFMGIMLGPLLQVVLRVPDGVSLIVIALLLTSIIFFVMSGIGYTTKKDFSFLGKFLLIGSIVLFVGIIANIFLHLPSLYLAICGAFVIFSSIMILWQINQIVRGGETNFISATLTLYISLYNLFTSLLQLILLFSGGNRR